MVSKNLKQEEVFECDLCGKTYNNKHDAEVCEEEDRFRQKINDLEYTKEFEIKNKHLKLLKNFYVGWNDVEFGAPEIDPKRPYGNSDVIQDIAEILGLVEEDHTLNVDEFDELYKRLTFLHHEMVIVLQIVLSTGKIKTGTYTRDNKYGIDWREKQ